MSPLEKQLASVASRYRRRDWWITMSATCIVLTIVGLVLLLVQVSAFWMHPHSGWWILGLGAAMLFAQWLTTRRKSRDSGWIAHQIENRFPELDHRLVTTLGELSRHSGQPMGYLQQSVLQETMAHAHHNGWWTVVPSKALQGVRSRALVAFCLMMASAIGLLKWQPPASAFLIRTSDAVEEEVAVVADFDIKIEPGDTSVEKGSNLIVIARFGKRVPKEAQLVATDGTEEWRIPMSRSLEDPLFGGTLTGVETDLEYYVTYGRSKSKTYRAAVFTYPQLVRGDALLEYPGYTDQAARNVEDTRRVSVVEGTRVTWAMHLNKPGDRGAADSAGGRRRDSAAAGSKRSSESFGFNTVRKDNSLAIGVEGRPGTREQESAPNYCEGC